MALPTGYLLTSYGEMVNCGPRMSAYAAALKAAITPGCTVLDVGAGSGIFALLACQYGAGKVIAVEPNDAIDLLTAAARANGCADRIDVVKGVSSDLDGSIRADVIISDLRGCLPLFESHIPAIIDARTRLLAPDGRMIPARDRLRIAMCSHAPSRELRDSPWLENDYGLDLSAGHRFAANHWHKVELGAGDLRSAPQDLAVLDYRTISDPNLTANASLRADRPCTVDGLAIWFDSELGDGIGFTNAPGEPLLVYGQTFFPLEQSVALGEGDRIEFAFRADLINGSYVYSWDSVVDSGGDDLHFRQSSFRSRLIPLDQLAAQSIDFVPSVEERHAVDRFCLGLIDGQRSLGAIAAEVMANYPTAFATATKALDHVAKLAQRYHSPRPTRKDAQ